MKRILVPTDFSPNANKALSFAAEIARRENGAIILIWVNNLIDGVFKEETFLEKKHNRPMEEACLLELESLKKDAWETMQVKVETRFYSGSVPSSILESAKENKAGLIVMGTLGDSGFKEKLFGSITAEVIDKSTIPVLVVPLLSEWEIPKKILLAIHHFDVDTVLTAPVFELAELFDANVTLTVFTDQDTSLLVDYAENLQEIIAYKEKLEERFPKTNIQSKNLHGHEFFETLDHYIKQQGINILAMLSHKRGFLQSIIKPNQASRMSYHTNIPLLSVPVK